MNTRRILAMSAAVAALAVVGVASAAFGPLPLKLSSPESQAPAEPPRGGPAALPPVSPGGPVRGEGHPPGNVVPSGVDDERRRGTGAPSPHVQLALPLPAGEPRRFAVDDAVSEEGGWLETPAAVEL